jgi:hypothetical protein
MQDFNLQNKSVSERNPFVFSGEPVWVRCDGFRCLAVQDRHGKWRSFCSGKELPDLVEVLESSK